MPTVDPAPAPPAPPASPASPASPVFGDSPDGRDRPKEADGFEGPAGWANEGRAYPYFDDAIEAMVVKHAGPWQIAVAPMIFNDRIILTHRDEYPRTWTAAFCYPKGAAAPVAALAWDPLTQREPAGYSRIAGDRDCPDRPARP